MSRLTKKNLLDILSKQEEIRRGQLVSVVSMIWGIDKDKVESVLAPLIASGEVELTPLGSLKVKVKTDEKS